MKIAIADQNNKKFTYDIIQHWEAKGHEVKFEIGSSEKLAQWADVYFVDSWTNNIHYLWKLYHGVEGVSRTDPWDNNKKPKIIVRVLDWEAWIGLVRDQSIVDWVDGIIFIAPHIQKKVESEVELKGKGVLIRPGVNLDRFSLKTKQTDGHQLGMVLGDMWPGMKGHMAGLDIFTTLYRKNNKWRLHIRGQHEPGEYWKAMYDHYLESRGIKDVVTLYSPVENMSEWYENIDILLHPGRKEAFCYAVGEAAAKGIKVVVNDFLGSHDIWPSEWLYQTHEEAVSMCSAIAFDSGQIPFTGIPSNRKYVEDNYGLKRMLSEFDNLLEV